MSDPTNWTFPEEFRPDPDELAFDLDEAIASVVQLRADVPADAFTASVLGTNRTGNGVVIGDDGLVLTIGYLVTEAESVWLTTHDGRVVAGQAGPRAGTDLDGVARSWWRAIRPYVSDRAVLLGHSLGAVLAVRLAELAGDELARTPVVLAAPPLHPGPAVRELLTAPGDAGLIAGLRRVYDEMEHLVVVLVMARGRVPDLHHAGAAVEVGARDQEVEPRAGRQQARARGRLPALHAGERSIELEKPAVAGEGRPLVEQPPERL